VSSRYRTIFWKFVRLDIGLGFLIAGLFTLWRTFPLTHTLALWKTGVLTGLGVGFALAGVVILLWDFLPKHGKKP
jgi:hypothetical protein